MKDRVTLKDIAKALNISIGTVERAIHGKHDINPDTKKMIFEKIDEMNYMPNKFARSLSVKNSKKLAVIMPIGSDFWKKVKAGIEFAEREMSYYKSHVEYICVEQMEEEVVKEHLNRLSQQKYDGVILVPVNFQTSKELLNQYIDDGMNIGFVNDDVSDVKRQFYIGPDHELIGKLAGELTGKFCGGKGKCLIISGINQSDGAYPMECSLRISGFKQAITTDYPLIDTEFVTYKLFKEDAHSAVIKRFKESTNDISAIYSVDGYLYEVASALDSMRIRDMSLVGHEISDSVNDQLSTGIVSATICQNPFLQGYYSLKYMMEYLVDKKLFDNDKYYINFNIYTKYNTYAYVWHNKSTQSCRLKVQS